MKILTFDTSLNKTYISLSENADIIENITVENKDDKYHSAFLIQTIADILKKNKLKMENINAVGIDIGPGSFTGIRACTTVGRVIAQQLHLPLVASSSLEILSKIIKGEKLVTLDARKNSAFVGIYDDDNEIQSPEIVSIDKLTETILNKKLPVICDNSMIEKLQLKDISIINYETQNYPLNTYLMEITTKKLQNSENVNEDFNWAKVKPLYIQPPSVFGQPLKIN